MVGGESLGCKTCKKRRVKCDGRWPVCIRCEKAKRFCPGPESRFRFYVGDHVQKRELEASIEHSWADEASSNHPTQSRTSSPERLAVSTSRPIHLSQSVCASSLETSRRLLIRLIESDDISPAFQLLQLGSFFEELPARLGHHVALDAVIECFVTSYARQYLPALLVTQNIGPSTELVAYGTAVNALRQELERCGAHDSEETLCAALSLFMYEYFCQQPSRQCIILAGGVSSIFKAWGPSRIRSSFALKLFESHYKTIITHGMVFGKDCFLHEPGWETVFRDSLESEAEERVVWLLLARIPDFLADVRSQVTAGFSDATAALTKGRHLRGLALLLDDEISKTLLEPEIFHVAPELYEGLHQPSCDGGLETKNTHEVVGRISQLRAGLLMVDAGLRRLGDSDPERLREEHYLTGWLFRTTPVARRFGMVDGAFYTLAGGAAFGASSEKQRKEIAVTVAYLVRKCADTEHLSQDQYIGSYLGLQFMYDTMTGCPVPPLPWAK